MLRCTRLCGRRRGVRWFAAHDRLTTLRDYLGGSVQPSVPRAAAGTARTMLHCTRRCGRAGAAVDVVRRASPVDDTARLGSRVLTTLRDYLEGSLSLRFCRGAGTRTMLTHEAVRARSRSVERFAGQSVDDTARLRHSVSNRRTMRDWPSTVRTTLARLGSDRLLTTLRD